MWSPVAVDTNPQWYDLQVSTQESGGLQDTLAQADGAMHPRSTPLKALAWPQGVLLTAGGSGTLRPEIRRSSMQPEWGRRQAFQWCTLQIVVFAKLSNVHCNNFGLEILTIKVIAFDLKNSLILEVWRSAYMDAFLLVHIQHLLSFQHQRGIVQVTVPIINL